MFDSFDAKWFSLFCALFNGFFALSSFLNGSWFFFILCGLCSAYCMSNFLRH